MKNFFSLKTTPPLCLTGFFLSIALNLHTAWAAEESLPPYSSAEQIPQTALDLWKDYDPRKEDLEIKVHHEWKEDGVVTRLVTFKVGTFKGEDSRLAAYYTFPENGKKNPAFVWCHGGGQRADRSRGHGFAKQGLATIDINWLGRPLEAELDPKNHWGTHWGKIDPTHDGNFYPYALRDEFKYSFHSDAHSIDPIFSPRNSNWFILSLAARRALTFLEQQPEVNADQLGMAGYSMGGMITSLTATDPRLKAAAPFIGGTANLYQNYDGMDAGADPHEIGDLDLHKNTLDPGAYWKHVSVPVVFLTSSNDQYAAFDRIYQSMEMLPHDQWRVSCNIHEQHKPGPEQWNLLTQWFHQHLAGTEQHLAPTPPSTLKIQENTAHFTVTPGVQNRLVAVEIYYSYDPRPITRFWKKAAATETQSTWKAAFPVHEKLPLYAFALCRYTPHKESAIVGAGPACLYSVNSTLHKHLPADLDLTAFESLPKSGLIDDFSAGTANWGKRGKPGFKTFKLQDPELDTSPENKLALTLDLHSDQEVIVNIELNGKYFTPGDEMGTFTYQATMTGAAEGTILVDKKDFTAGKSKNNRGVPLEWNRVTTFGLTLTDAKTKQKINLSRPPGSQLLKHLELVKDED